MQDRKKSLKFWWNSLSSDNISILFQGLDIMIFETKTAEQYYEDSYQLMLTKQLPEAIDFCKRATRLKPKYRPPYLRLGNILSRYKRYQEAYDYYNRYLHYAQQDEDQYDLSRAYNALGHFHTLRREVSDALKYLFLSLDLVKSFKQPLEVARVYNNIALVHRIEKDYEKSEYYYKKAIEFCKKDKADDRLVYYFFNIAIMYKEQKKVLKSLWYLGKFRKLKQRLAKKGYFFYSDPAIQLEKS